MRLMYYSPASQTFSSAPSSGAVAVPGLVYQEFMDDQRAGAPMELAQDGSMPLVVYQLLTLNGLRLAVSREFKQERALWTNALVTAGYKLQRQLQLLPPPPQPAVYGDPPPVDPNGGTRAQVAAVLAGLDAALLFLEQLLTQPDVLAVQPGTGPGQGAQVLKDVIYNKWLAYAAAAPGAVKAVLAAVI